MGVLKPICNAPKVRGQKLSFFAYQSVHGSPKSNIPENLFTDSLKKNAMNTEMTQFRKCMSNLLFSCDNTKNSSITKNDLNALSTVFQNSGKSKRSTSDIPSINT